MEQPDFRILPWPILALAALLLSGCPYSSEFPLDSPSGALTDAALPGVWEASDESEEDFTLTIRSSGGAELILVAESPGEEAASYPAFMSEVGGQRFLNLQDAAQAGRWYFASYRLEGDQLRLRLVDDELTGPQPFASAQELRSFLLRNLDDPRLYGGEDVGRWDWVLQRVEPASPD